MRVLLGRAANLSHEFLDEETPLTQTSVSVTVTDALGAEVATGAASASGDSWTFTVPVADLKLGVYTVTWTGDTATDTEYFEVVGNHLFTIPEARSSDEYLTDSVAFPTADMVAGRETVEREFEQITHRSFTTKARVMRYIVSDYRATEVLGLLPDSQSIVSLTVNGTPVDDITKYGVTSNGSIFIKGNSSGINFGGPFDWAFYGTPSEAPWRRGDEIIAVVAYGMERVPEEVKRVAMIRLRHNLAAEDSAIPDRATTWQPQEGGTFRLATPGMGKSETGIPEVDAVLARYSLDALVGLYGIV